jgi:hypothetical protein
MLSQKGIQTMHFKTTPHLKKAGKSTDASFFQLDSGSIVICGFLLLVVVTAWAQTDSSLTVTKQGSNVALDWQPATTSDMFYSFYPNEGFSPLVCNANPILYHIGAAVDSNSYYYLVGNFSCSREVIIANEKQPEFVDSVKAGLAANLGTNSVTAR